MTHSRPGYVNLSAPGILHSRAVFAPPTHDNGGYGHRPSPLSDAVGFAADSAPGGAGTPGAWHRKLEVPMHRGIVVVAVFALALIGVGCGASGPSQQEQDATAVKRLVAEEEALLRRGRNFSQTASQALRRAETCALLEHAPCAKVSSLVAEGYLRKMQAVNRQIRQIHGEIDEYPRTVVAGALSEP